MSLFLPWICPPVEGRGETGGNLPRTDAAEGDPQGQLAHFEDVDVRPLRPSCDRPALALLDEFQPFRLDGKSKAPFDRVVNFCSPVPLNDANVTPPRPGRSAGRSLTGGACGGGR